MHGQKRTYGAHEATVAAESTPYARQAAAHSRKQLLSDGSADVQPPVDVTPESRSSEAVEVLRMLAVQAALLSDPAAADGLPIAKAGSPPAKRACTEPIYSVRCPLRAVDGFTCSVTFERRISRYIIVVPLGVTTALHIADTWSNMSALTPECALSSVRGLAAATHLLDLAMSLVICESTLGASE